jgi:hypothetical protein
MTPSALKTRTHELALHHEELDLDGRASPDKPANCNPRPVDHESKPIVIGQTVARDRCPRNPTTKVDATEPRRSMIYQPETECPRQDSNLRPMA